MYKPSMMDTGGLCRSHFLIMFGCFYYAFFLETTKATLPATRVSFFNFWVRSFGVPAIFDFHLLTEAPRMQPPKGHMSQNGCLHKGRGILSV